MKIHKTKISQLVSGLNGRIATVRFVKKDGSVRDINFRLGVSKGVKGAARNRLPVERFDTPYVTAYDLKKQSYRNINLDTVIFIKAHGVTYYVV